MRELTPWQTYTRKEAHDVFEPDTDFTPQTGTWGLQGIVRLAEDPRSFAFFVTFGKSSGGHAFEEDITADGVLTWQSQPSQRLDHPTIQQLIAHDDLNHSIHLFLRTRSKLPYTYLGQVGYLDHDPSREAPVYFKWQLKAWPAPPAVLNDLKIAPSAPTEPTSPITPLRGKLTQTEPPKVSVVPGATAPTGGSGNRKARLPGHDARNAKLGRAGENLVLKHERQRLEDAGRPDLAETVVHVSVVEGDSAGYDVRSFNVDGAPRHLEVKTTQGPATTGFFISPNELMFSVEHPDSYVLLRVYGYSYDSHSANYYEVRGNVADSFELTPSEYRVRLLPSTGA